MDLDHAFFARWRPRIHSIRIRAPFPFLGPPTQVVVSGCSAGGTSVYLQLDKVAAALPNVKNVRGLADAGFVQNLVGETTGTNYTHIRFQNASQLWGQFSSNAACQAAHTAVDDLWTCLTPQYVLPYVKTPVFILAAEVGRLQIRRLACHAE